jgi:Leucine rich repeat
MTVAVLLVVVLAPVLVISQPSSPSSIQAVPSFSPTPLTKASSSRAQQVTAFINNITLTGLTLVHTSKDATGLALQEEQALRWLIDYDTDLNLVPTTPSNRFRLQQRYALAILQVQPDAPFHGSMSDECDWGGVTCRSVNLGDEIGIQQAATAIFIDTYNNGQRWSGQLSADLALLSTLIHFNMSSGSGVFGINGGLMKRLPSQIGRWTDLEYLDLSANALTGSLPREIGEMVKLRYFAVNSNYLTGALPSQIGLATNLQAFYASFNTLSGSLPTQIGQLTNLHRFSVSMNRLTGSIPSQIEKMSNLQGLDLSANTLTGSLPSQIGQLTKLKFLSIDANNLTAEIPSSVCLLRNAMLKYLSADCVAVSCSPECCTSCC